MPHISDEEWRDRLRELYEFSNLPDVVDMVSVSDLPDEVRSDLLGVVEPPCCAAKYQCCEDFPA